MGYWVSGEIIRGVAVPLSDLLFLFESKKNSKKRKVNQDGSKHRNNIQEILESLQEESECLDKIAEHFKWPKEFIYVAYPKGVEESYQRDDWTVDDFQLVFADQMQDIDDGDEILVGPLDKTANNSTIVTQSQRDETKKVLTTKTRQEEKLKVYADPNWDILKPIIDDIHPKVLVFMSYG